MTPSEVTQTIGKSLQCFVTSHRRLDFLIIYPAPTHEDNHLLATLNRQYMQENYTDYTVSLDVFLERSRIHVHICTSIVFSSAPIAMLERKQNMHKQYSASEDDIGRIDRR